MSTSTRYLSDNEADAYLINKAVPWFLRPFRMIVKKVICVVVNRAFERGKISSHAYHEIRAITDRAFPFKP